MRSITTLLSIILLYASCSNDKKIIDADIYSNQFIAKLDSFFDAEVDRSPVQQTYLNIKKDYDAWDDISEASHEQDLRFAKNYLAELDNWDYEKMNPQAKLSYTMYQKRLIQQIENDAYRHNGYLSHQMHGIHDFIPSFLITFHSIDNEKEARDYISRIKNGNTLIHQGIDQLKLREDKGFLAPFFVYDHVINSSKNIISGKPFDSSGEDCAVINDFKSKIGALDINKNLSEELIIEANKALVDDLKPAYVALIQLFENQKSASNTDDGVWKMSNGRDYYKSCLQEMTTTNLSAQEIFDIGMSEIQRIHGEMEVIKEKVGYKGSLSDFFDYMRFDKKFFNSNDDAGREKYLNAVSISLDEMRAKLDDLFKVKPKANFVVKRVEKFREKAAGKAFYNRSAPDGSRPGTYYVNLYDMNQMPTYQMEALAYHEAIPGHHMQISINQELEGLPKFRTLDINYIAYTEGWGLYSEYIPKEFGFYKDPFSDFGRLAMELWRSCRLAADVGIHDKNWTREEAIDFYKTNTPNPEGDCVKMVERHIVMPGQATAYKIGQMKILALKNKSEKELGDQFDIREFHEVVLKNGAVPLDILESLVDDYIQTYKSL